MKEAVTKVIDMLTQADFHEAFQMLLERYNKYIAAGGDFYEGDLSSMCVLSIKVPVRKKSGNLFNDPRAIKQNNLKPNDHLSDATNATTIGTSSSVMVSNVD